MKNKIKSIKARPRSKISLLRGREILDSRGNPTVEVNLITEKGVFSASVPSGASVGKYEALELRDGEKRYRGKGVLKAIKNVNEIIGPKLIGKDPTNQREIDNLMIELDGTKNKSNLGANAILAVSMAVCRAGATAKNIPLYQYLAQLAENRSPLFLPNPCLKLICGGAHAGNDLDIQEFMITLKSDSFKETLRGGTEIYWILKTILKKRCGEIAINIGDEGGFSPPLWRTQQVLDLIIEAIKEAGYQNNVKICLDCAASQFFKDGNYQFEKAVFTKEGLLTFYQDLVKNYPILFLEDPFSEEDWEGFLKVRKIFGKKIIIFGDDLLSTNIKRIKEAKEKEACDGLVLKINQIGTITEALEARKLAKDFGWKIMVSHRSGETNDDFISDLAVGIGADFIKAGAPARGERVAKYNRLLKIEEELRSAS